MFCFAINDNWIEYFLLKFGNLHLSTGLWGVQKNIFFQSSNPNRLGGGDVLGEFCINILLVLATCTKSMDFSGGRRSSRLTLRVLNNQSSTGPPTRWASMRKSFSSSSVTRRMLTSWSHSGRSKRRDRRGRVQSIKIRAHQEHFWFKNSK